ncbi:phage baseplate protein, partial [Lachnotalea glycerini]
FYMREKAIFASDGTKEVLVLYANAGSLAEYIEPSTSEVYEKILRSILLFSQSDKVNITMYDSGYANALDFQKHIENESIHVTGEDKSKWNEHLNCIATTTSSGHIKIGKGLQVQNGVTSVNLSALIDAIYPIGTVYTSVKDVSPEVFLGGKWERFAEGRTTVGVDLNNSNYNAAGKTGGSATTRLNASNVPSHTHNFSWTGKPSGSASTNVAIYESGNHIHTAGSLTANDTGLTGYIGNIITERESGITCSGVFSQRTSVSSSRYGGGTQSNKAPDFADFNATHGHSLRGNTEWGGQHGHTAAASTILNFNNMTVAGNTSAVGNGTDFNNLQPYVTEFKWVRVA